MSSIRSQLVIIADQAMAFGDSRVTRNAVLSGMAVAKDRVVVTDNAHVGDQALLDQDPYIGGNTILKCTTYVTPRVCWLYARRHTCPL